MHPTESDTGAHFGRISIEEYVDERKMYAKQKRNTTSKTSAFFTFLLRSRVRMLLIATPLLFTVICVFLATASSAEEMENTLRRMPTVSAPAPIQWGQDISEETTTTTESEEQTTTTTMETTTETTTSSTITTVNGLGLTTQQTGGNEGTKMDMSQNETDVSKVEETVSRQNITDLNIVGQSSHTQPSFQQSLTAAADNVSVTAAGPSESFANISNENGTAINSTQKENATEASSILSQQNSTADSESKAGSDALSHEPLSSDNISNMTMASEKNETYFVIPSPNVDRKQQQSLSDPEMTGKQPDSNVANPEVLGNDMEGVNVTLFSSAVTFVTEIPPTVSNPIFPPALNISDCAGNASLCSTASIQSDHGNQTLIKEEGNSTMEDNNQLSALETTTQLPSLASFQFSESLTTQAASQNLLDNSISTKNMNENPEKVQDQTSSTLNEILPPVGEENNDTDTRNGEIKEDSTDNIDNQEQDMQEDDDNGEEKVVENDQGENNAEVQSLMDNKPESLSDDAVGENNLMMKGKWKASDDKEEW